MSPTRRALLKWLPAVALTPPLRSFGSVRGEGGPVNLVGFGGAGPPHTEALRGGAPRGARALPRRPGGAARGRRRGHLRQRAAGARRRRSARGILASWWQVSGTGRAESPPSSSPRRRGTGGAATCEGLLVLPFEFEGHRRERGVAQAARFVRRFPDSLVIDNEWFLGSADEERLLDVYERANAFAAAALAQLTGLQ